MGLLAKMENRNAVEGIVAHSLTVYVIMEEGKVRIEPDLSSLTADYTLNLAWEETWGDESAQIMAASGGVAWPEMIMWTDEPVVTVWQCRIRADWWEDDGLLSFHSTFENALAAARRYFRMDKEHYTRENVCPDELVALETLETDPLDSDAQGIAEFTVAIDEMTVTD